MINKTDIQAQVIVLLRELDYNDLAEEVIARATRQVRDWYHLKPGDSFMAMVRVRSGKPLPYVPEEGE